MSDLNRGHEYEFEPEFGLPEPLPATERMLWQGSPDWKAMARHVFHVRKLAVYFSVILLARGITEWSFGGSVSQAIVSALWLLPLALTAIGLMAYFAYLTARTTVYTITDRRVVMRVGIVLTLTFNLPYTRLASANLREFERGVGDIAVGFEGADKIAYVHLWPHARPWQMAKPQPMMRCVPDAKNVAQILTRAWSDRRAALSQQTPLAAEPSAVNAMHRASAGSRQMSAA
jgi:hypothetical protein